MGVPGGDGGGGGGTQYVKFEGSTFDLPISVSTWWPCLAPGRPRQFCTPRKLCTPGRLWRHAVGRLLLTTAHR